MIRIIILFLYMSLFLVGKTYNIGDKIDLKVKGLGEDKLAESFKDWDVEKVETKDGYTTISFRGYNLGENEIILGDKRLIVELSPTTTPEEVEIYPDFQDSENKFYQKEIPYLAIFFILVALTSFGTLMYGVISERNKKPDVKFLKGMSKVNEINWKQNLSLLLRSYIDGVYNTHFLSGNYEVVGGVSEEELNFLNELDYLKFSPNKDGNYEDYKERTMRIFEKIKLEKERKGNV
ncbi:MAG: hypothetical protein RSD79_06035 [Cetobacterium sp.]|uniref:hypothetical protein n=1 Tax=Cetobacterium sp. TaxID=2071632 RepID=UPI002FCABFBD